MQPSCCSLGDVEPTEQVALGDVPVVRTALSVRTCTALGVTERVVRSVVLERPGGEHLLGIRIQPPVEQIEVMAGFVDKERARTPLLPVPPAEVVRTVIDVEVPVEVDRRHPANSVRHQELFQARAMRRIAIVVGDDDVSAGPLLGV